MEKLNAILMQLERDASWLADKLDVNPATVSRWCNGETRPGSRQLIIEISNILEISASECRSLIETAGYQLDDRVNKTIETVLVGKAFPRNPLITSLGPNKRPPKRYRHFVGREYQIKVVSEMLLPGNICTVYGLGGVGKTTLVTEITWRLAPNEKPPESYPDGVFYFSIHNLHHIDSVFDKITRHFKEEPEPNLESAVERILGGRQLLLVLDGADHVEDLELLENIIHERCVILLTSRYPANILGNGYHLLRFEPDEAKALLLAMAGNRAQNAKVVERICYLVGYLPLAVWLIGRHIEKGKTTAKDYLAILEKNKLDGVNNLARMSQHSLSLIISASLAHVEQLIPQDKLIQQIMGIVGLLAGAPFDWKAISAALDFDESDVTQVLSQMVLYSLLDRPDDYYVVIHSLIHEYFHENYDNSIDERILSRLANHYSMCAEASQEDSYHLSLHVLKLLKQCNVLSLHESSLGLAKRIYPYLDRAGNKSDRELVTGIGMKSAQALAENAPNTDESQEIHLEHVKWIARQGNLYTSQGKTEIAIEFLKTALSRLANLRIAKHSKINSQREEIEGRILRNLGAAQLESELEEAINNLSKGLSIAEKIGDMAGTISAWSNLGIGRQKQGNIEEAIKCQQIALRLSRETQDVSPDTRKGEMISLGNLGNIYVSMGDYQKALSYYDETEKIASEIGDARNQVNWLSNKGHVYRQLGREEEAKDYFEKALDIGRKLDDIPIQKKQLRNLSDTCGELGEVENVKNFDAQLHAITANEERSNSIRRLHKARRHDDVFNQLSAYMDLGEKCLQDNQLKFAISYYNQALDAAKKILAREKECECLLFLSIAFLLSHQEVQAIDRCRRGVTMIQKYGNREETVIQALKILGRDELTVTCRIYKILGLIQTLGVIPPNTIFRYGIRIGHTFWFLLPLIEENKLFLKNLAQNNG
ncbi:MAG: tetratricopeptide repeat protein [Bacteroidota bacterium]